MTKRQSFTGLPTPFLFLKCICIYNIELKKETKMKKLFNLYLDNIDERITRGQYWAFTALMIAISIILLLINQITNINVEQTVIVIDLLFIWPSILVMAKRLNDIGSDFLTFNIMIAVLLAWIPDWYDMPIIWWIFIGFIPTNYIKNNAKVY
jgi:uncharacterized membrane protein YhaH (DUF805 family)